MILTVENNSVLHTNCWKIIDARLNVESRLPKSAKRHYWDKVFSTLAEADGDELQSKGAADKVDYGRGAGVPTIHITKLKAFLQEEKSLKVLPRKQNFCIMLKDRLAKHTEIRTFLSVINDNKKVTPIFTAGAGNKPAATSAYAPGTIIDRISLFLGFAGNILEQLLFL